jgi:hypothetical protein
MRAGINGYSRKRARSEGYEHGYYATPDRGYYATPDCGYCATPDRGYYATPDRGYYATPDRGYCATPDRGYCATPDRGYCATLERDSNPMHGSPPSTMPANVPANDDTEIEDRWPMEC